MEQRELTWEDMRLINHILDKMIDEDIAGDLPEELDEEKYYTEVLRRFKEINKNTVYIPSVWLKESTKKTPSVYTWAYFDDTTGEYKHGEQYYDGNMNEVTKEEYERLKEKPGD